jgi:hypothetical protein
LNFVAVEGDQALACTNYAAEIILIYKKLILGPSQGIFSDGDTAGWTLNFLDGTPAKFSAVADSSGGLSGTDTKSAVWYFTAPQTFSGNFVNAYNGKIEVPKTDRPSPFSNSYIRLTLRV